MAYVSLPICFGLVPAKVVRAVGASHLNRGKTLMRLEFVEQIRPSAGVIAFRTRMTESRAAATARVLCSYETRVTSPDGLLDQRPANFQDEKIEFGK
jgi:hypothetical protein